MQLYLVRGREIFRSVVNLYEEYNISCYLLPLGLLVMGSLARVTIRFLPRIIVVHLWACSREQYSGVQPRTRDAYLVRALVEYGVSSENRHLSESDVEGSRQSQ
jgi:hypothetical protein